MGKILGRCCAIGPRHPGRVHAEDLDGVTLGMAFAHFTPGQVQEVSQYDASQGVRHLVSLKTAMGGMINNYPRDQ
jgi:hypothetical protein